MAKAIGVLSLKGGVGKTSVIVALGHALSDFGKKVLLIDGNFSAPNLGLHLNVLEPFKGIHEVLRGDAHAKDAVYNLNNLDLIPAGLFNNHRFSPMKLRDRIKNLKRTYDIVLIDSSPRIDEETLAIMNACDELLVVTTPDHAALGATLKTIKLARQREIPLLGLIVNKVYNKNFETSMEDIENVLEIPVMAVIPHDINILKSLSDFKSLTKQKPKSEASEEFRKLAAALIGEKYKPVRVRNFFRWMKPRKQDINRTIFYERVFKS